MSRHPSVVVVGAGIAGLSTAVELARLGCSRVTLIDRAYPASGSSGLSAGIYNRQYVDRRDLEIRALGASILETLEGERRIQIVHNGFMRLARDEATLPSFDESVAMQREYGLPGAAVLAPEQVGRVIPEMDLTGVVGGLYGANDGYVDGYELCSTYAEEATERGVTVRLREPIVGFATRTSGTHVVTTPNREIEADVVVNAAGAWAGPVGEIVGAPVPLNPQRHEAFVFQLPDPAQRLIPSVMDYVVGSPEPGLYFRGESDRQLLAGLHTNEIVAGEEVADPDGYFRGVIAERVEQIAARLLAALPPLADMGFHSGWAGLYPLSPDGRPVVGPAGDGGDGRFLACGLGGVGMQLGPAVGRLVAEWIAVGEPRSMPSANELTVDRFASAERRSGGAEARDVA